MQFVPVKKRFFVEVLACSRRSDSRARGSDVGKRVKWGKRGKTAGGEWGTPRENEVVDFAGHGNSREKWHSQARARTLNRFQIIIIWDRDSLSDLILSWERLEQAIGVFMDFDFVMVLKNAEENVSNI